MNAPTKCPSCARPLTGPGYRCPHCGKFLTDVEGALDVPECSGAFEIGEQALEPKRARTGAVELPEDLLAELQIEVPKPGGPSAPVGRAAAAAPPSAWAPAVADVQAEAEAEEEAPLELADDPAPRGPARVKTSDYLAGVPDRAPPPLPPPPPRPFAAPRPVPKAVWVALGLVVVVLGLWSVRPRRFPVVPLEPARAGLSDPCLLRPKCVVVVVSPWCPACKMAVPVIKDFGQRFEKSEEIGFKVVVAGDTPENVREMAAQLGGKVPAFLDPQGELLKAVGERGVPHWFVVGDGFKILEQRSGLMTGGAGAATEQLRVLGLLDSDG